MSSLVYAPSYTQEAGRRPHPRIVLGRRRMSACTARQLPARRSDVSGRSTQGGTIFNTGIILLFYNTYFTLYSGSPGRIIRYYPHASYSRVSTPCPSARACKVRAVTIRSRRVTSSSRIARMRSIWTAGQGTGWEGVERWPPDVSAACARAGLCARPTNRRARAAPRVVEHRPG